jgi:hypothetical protein
MTTPTTPRKRGRPPKPEGPSKQTRLPSDLLPPLTAIAEREQLYHGPAPSITGAIRWLVEGDQKQ